MGYRDLQSLGRHRGVGPMSSFLGPPQEGRDGIPQSWEGAGRESVRRSKGPCLELWAASTGRPATKQQVAEQWSPPEGLAASVGMETPGRKPKIRCGHWWSDRSAGAWGFSGTRQSRRDPGRSLPTGEALRGQALGTPGWHPLVPLVLPACPSSDPLWTDLWLSEPPGDWRTSVLGLPL